MKILMLTEFFYPFDRGGSEWSTFYLAKKLTTYKHSVKIFTPNYGTNRYESYAGIQIERFPFYKHLLNTSAIVSPIFYNNIFFWLWTTIVLWRKVKKNRPDVVHIQGKYFLPAAVVVGKLLHIPTMVTLRDYITLCPYGFCISKSNHYRACNLVNIAKKDLVHFLRFYTTTNKFVAIPLNLIMGLYGWVTSWWLRLFLFHVDSRVAISQKLARIYSVNQVKISRVIYNTVEMDQKTAARIKVAAPIVFVGRCTPGKGVAELVTAYRQLKQSQSIPDLVIIGSGSKARDIKALGDSQIRLKGQLPYQETMTYIAQARLVVVPSQWEEPFGRVALEALSVGTPVIVTNRGGLSEIVEDQVTGYIVEPHPAALREGIRKGLKYNAKLRISIKKAHQKLQQKFSQAPVSQYATLYTQLIHRHD